VAKDLNQGPTSPLCHQSGGGVCQSDSGLAADRQRSDQQRATWTSTRQPAKSVQGWKGLTAQVNYEIAKIALSDAN
jgi:hypothetical protein